MAASADEQALYDFERNKSAINDLRKL